MLSMMSWRIPLKYSNIPTTLCFRSLQPNDVFSSDSKKYIPYQFHPQIPEEPTWSAGIFCSLTYTGLRYWTRRGESYNIFRVVIIHVEYWCRAGVTPSLSISGIPVVFKKTEKKMGAIMLWTYSTALRATCYNEFSEGWHYWGGKIVEKWISGVIRWMFWEMDISLCM